MDKLLRSLMVMVMFVTLVAFSGMLTACGKQNEPQATTSPSAGTTPPPPGDSTPKAIDSNANIAKGANEQTGNAGGSQQSTTGSAASGAPPYSLQAGPEGNPTPNQGTQDRTQGAPTSTSPNK